MAGLCEIEKGMKHWFRSWCKRFFSWSCSEIVISSYSSRM